MRGFIGRFLINLLLLAFVAWLFQGIEIRNPLALLFAGIIFGLLNAFIRPLLILITLPISILTVGLFIFIINGILFWLTSVMVKDFYISSIWIAIAGAFVYSISSLIISMLLSDAGRIEVIQFRK